MHDLPIVTCACEGGLYSPDRDPTAPIRIYEDGRIEDDYFGGVRDHYGADRLREIIDVAKSNRAQGIA